MRSDLLLGDMMVHPNCVNSAIGSPGFPILGVALVYICAYSFVPRIRCTGRFESFTTRLASKCGNTIS